ncbi:unnamed protein product, partial [Brachionus calyciflorus]
SQIWCIYPQISYGSCRDILNAIQAYYTTNSDQTSNTNNNNNNIDRVDEQIRLCFNEQSIQHKLYNGFLNKPLHEYLYKIDNYVNYLSHEILNRNLIGYNSKSDIYSLSVTICKNIRL